MSGYVDYDHESGKCAYEAYRRTNEYGSHTDRRLPEWDNLPANIKEGWIAAAGSGNKTRR